MREKRLFSLFFIIVLVAAFFSSRFSLLNFAESSTIPTSVSISVCGNGIRESIESCDEGPLNSNHYAISEAERNCGTTCAWAPYCADRILQPSYGETCDDGNNSANDGCDAVCKAEAPPPPPPPPPPAAGAGPFNPGAFAPLAPTKVIMQGKAYPNSDVHILKDGEVIGVVRADAKADFSFTTAELTPGIATFGFWSQDSTGLKSTSFTATFKVLSNALTTISGIYLPPTIAIDKKSVAKGGTLNVSGTSIPQVDVVSQFNSEKTINKKTQSDSSGKWSLVFNTSDLEPEDFHTVKSFFESTKDGNIIKSGFSQAISFYVGEKSPKSSKTADINGDNLVSLVDFSILLFNWGKSNPKADINGDGVVNLTDFSMMMFQWTG